jgi:hypothetical protein
LLNELSAELANLYGDSESARRLVDEAGIPDTFIPFDGLIINVWYRIVQQASVRQKMPNLLRAALKGYPQNVTLQSVLWLYEHGHYQDKDDEGGMGGRYSGEDYSPRLNERVTRVEEKQVALQISVSEGFRLLNERLDNLSAAISTRPATTGSEQRTERFVIGIGVAVGVLIVVLMMLWLRLGNLALL